MLKQEVADKLTELINPMNGIAKRIVDIGTGWAESAEFFSILKPDWTIYTIDSFGLYGDGRIYSKINHDEVVIIDKKIHDLGNVILIFGNSNDIFWELPIDVLFIDGDHRYEGCRSDFLNFSQFIVPGGLVVFDDYTQENYPENGVKEVVTEILNINSKSWELIYEGYYCAILKKL